MYDQSVTFIDADQQRVNQLPCSRLATMHIAQPSRFVPSTKYTQCNYGSLVLFTFRQMGRMESHTSNFKQPRIWEGQHCTAVIFVPFKKRVWKSKICITSWHTSKWSGTEFPIRTIHRTVRHSRVHVIPLKRPAEWRYVVFSLYLCSLTVKIMNQLFHVVKKVN